VTHDGSSAVAGVREGDVLAGKYRVERVLGVGGMGVVVAAHHVQLDSKVALKFLLPAMLGHREAVDRFAREARAAVKITNEHVARVTDVGTLDNGAPYMVMEFLEGGDLADWIRQHGPLPVEQAVDFVLQACIAIADAHTLGIVHRDLKPANLFCVRRSDGQFLIKVLDFGISKMNTLGTSNPGGSVTQTSSIMGSPLYMSPEQMQSPKSVDAKTDIWAMGVVLYELLTGHTPFDGETIAEVAVKAATQLPPSIRAQRPDVHPDLEAAIFKCLAKDRNERHANVAELAVSLLSFAPFRARASVDRISGIIHSSGLSVSAMTVPASSPLSTSAVHGTISPVGHTAAGRTAGTRGPGHAKTIFAAFAGVFGLLALASFAVLRSKHDHAAPDAPPPVASSLSAIETATARTDTSLVPPPPATVMPSASAPAATPSSNAPSSPASNSAPIPAPVHPRPVATAHEKPPPPAPVPAPAPPAPSPASADPLSKLHVK
jgi:serine/threonine protein kinase